MLNWQKVVLSSVALLVVGVLAYHGELSIQAFIALFGGIVLPGPLSMTKPPEQP